MLGSEALPVKGLLCSLTSRLLVVKGGLEQPPVLVPHALSPSGQCVTPLGTCAGRVFAQASRHEYIRFCDNR